MAEKTNNFFSGAENIIKGLAEKREKYLESLKDLPCKSEIFPVAELKQLRDVNLFINFAIERFEQEVKLLETAFGKDGKNDPEAFEKAKNEVEQKTLSDLMATLDRLDVWSHKFSTESQGTSENLTETPNDSVYYMSLSGASLRLKTANRSQGVKKVVQPIMEKIFFDKPGEAVSETPKLGYFVREYATHDFLNKLEEETIDSDYQSSIRKYERGNKIEIPKLDNIKIDHEGSPVNKINF